MPVAKCNLELPLQLIKNVYAIPSEANKKGVLLPYVNFEDRCTNCGVCEVSCPDQAITVDVDGNWWVKEDSYNFNPKFSQAK